LRMAWAPKLMRRAKGVVGAVRALVAPSSSSTAFSSIESELLVDRLARRMLNGLELVGDVPDRPTVVTDRRRCGLPMAAAVVMGPGKTAVPADVELLLWKRLVKAAEVTEPRRLRDMSGELPFWLSGDDMVTLVRKRRRGCASYRERQRERENRVPKRNGLFW